MQKEVKSAHTCFTVFSQRLAGWLMVRGFVLVGITPGRADARRNVFYFNQSNELMSAIEEYKRSY